MKTNNESQLIRKLDASKERKNGSIINQVMQDVKKKRVLYKGKFRYMKGVKKKKKPSTMLRIMLSYNKKKKTKKQTNCPLNERRNKYLKYNFILFFFNIVPNYKFFFCF